MINNERHPVAWALLLYELDDARDHIAALTAQIAADGQIDEEDYRIQLGHVFGQLNFAWNSRDEEVDLVTDDHAERRHFPVDLEPI